jgi:hypothetical protein
MYQLKSSVFEIMIAAWLCTVICNSARTVSVLLQLSPLIYFCIHRYLLAFCNNMLSVVTLLAQRKKPSNCCVCASVLQVLFCKYVWFCSFWQICVCIFLIYKDRYICLFFTNNMPNKCKFNSELQIEFPWFKAGRNKNERKCIICKTFVSVGNKAQLWFGSTYQHCQAQETNPKLP